MNNVLSQVLGEDSEYRLIRMGEQDTIYTIEMKFYYYNNDNNDFEEKLQEINVQFNSSIQSNPDLKNQLTAQNIQNMRLVYQAMWFNNKESIIYDLSIQ